MNSSSKWISKRREPDSPAPPFFVYNFQAFVGFGLVSLSLGTCISALVFLLLGKRWTTVLGSFSPRCFITLRKERGLVYLSNSSAHIQQQRRAYENHLKKKSFFLTKKKLSELCFRPFDMKQGAGAHVVFQPYCHHTWDRLQLLSPFFGFFFATFLLTFHHFEHTNPDLCIVL